MSMWRKLFGSSVAILEVSPAAFDEIAAKLAAAGFEHAFVDGIIVMQTVGLSRAAKEEVATPEENDPIARHRARVLANKA